MNYSIIRYILGWVMSMESAFMILPFIVGLIYGEDTAYIFLGCAVVFGLVGFFMTRNKPKNTLFYAREGFVTVALSWILLGIVGALPFVISGEIPGFVNAVFETISGFTTTGASILPRVEDLSKCMLFWRSFTHWIGGMGVLVFVLAVLPLAGGQTMHIMKAESPGPSVGKLVPKIRNTAIILYLIYFVMTIIEFVILVSMKMPVFDAICTTFGTAGTGGFGVRSDSMASYGSGIQIVVTVFMFLFGVNFNFYYLLLLKQVNDAFSMEEVKWYFIVFAGAVGLITINLAATSGDFWYHLKHAAFQVSSIMTTTGFATMDFNLWPQFSKTILVLLMFVGACAGSTGGGIKVSRFIIYIRTVTRELSYLIHQRSVKVIKMDGKVLSSDVVRACNIFLITYILIFSASVVLVAFDSFDMTTSFTAVAATFNNIGPGLELVGPNENFNLFSNFSKIILIFDMLAGRLEIFPLLLLFVPESWRKN